MRFDTPRILLAALGCTLAVAASFAACNSHPVDYRPAGGAVEQLQQVSGGGGGKVDILWVIDNSTSMCQEQESLRQSFKQFITTLDERTAVNFHIGVTTTHFTKRAGFERVARPGRLQALPHPVVGFQDACRFQENNGKKDFSPIKKQIQAAASCTKKSVNPKTNFSKKELKCALIDTSEQGNDPHSFCEDIGKKDGDFTVVDLFPCAQSNGGDACKKRSQFASVYRKIPKTLRATEYRKNDGSLKVKQLKKDFSCMSFVGTRGDSFEQGLNAAAKAVSPLMTGGPENNPYEGKSFKKHFSKKQENIQDGSTRPNHGFIRSDATTALIFVTDENDCSHIGQKILKLGSGGKNSDGNKCGELNCYFPTSSKREGSGPLIKTEKLYNEFIDNLKQSKRVNKLRQGDLLIGSIHGDVKGFDKLVKNIPKKCSSKTQTKLRGKLVTCSSAQGEAKSGGRYAQFMNLANSNGYSVVPQNTGNGFICAGDSLGQPLTRIAKELRGEVQGCLDYRVLACNTSGGSSNCPDFEYSGSGGGNVCQQWPNASGQKDGYCTSAIRLRLSPTGNQKLKDLPSGDQNNFRNKFCIKDSIGGPAPDACVVKRSLYNWVQCPGDDNSLTLQWDSQQIPDPQRAFGAFDVEARYTRALGSTTQQSGGNSGNQ